MPLAPSKMTGARHRWQIGHILWAGSPLSPLRHDCGVWSRCVVSSSSPPPDSFTCKAWLAAVALGVCCGLRAHLRDNEDRQPVTDHLLCSCQVPVSESAFSTPPILYPSACSMTPLPDRMEVRWHTLPFIIHITAVLEYDLQLEMHNITIPDWLTADIRFCLLPFVLNI